MPVTDDDIEQLVAAMDRGRAAWMNGKLETEAPDFPVRQADEMTIFGPFGGIAPRGTAPIARPAMQQAMAAKFKGGTGNCELVQAFYEGDLAVLVMIERNEVHFDGHDGPLPWILRTTQIFRKERDGWIRLHRHADPLVRFRDLDQTLSLLDGD
jgi:ketosteroid isomerase-like protein